MNVDEITVNTRDEAYMLEALREAYKARDMDEVPVGAVVVFDDKIISAAHNMVEHYNNSSAHAEMLAISQAEKSIGYKWLEKATLYVTLEPCSMCAGAMVLARIGRLVIGTMDPKHGACGSVVNIANNDGFNHRIEVTKGILSGSCGEILTEYFRAKRIANKRR